ncbi:hypothetical protein KM176_05555 [Pseudooceanicola sp. CBS1P-1]|uniref:Uncharacterized protein n=1 Tax=Pseudooceanicola albus TaxID=2692189 RepID=A0A6L7FXD2_9RHOB|nr:MULTISPECIES: hypothetical protein [Pseudooceanicola]MBT9383318.1 hypothetical protein [Pseudooceanicola endophyticus]MXN16359.1 hypothetical protein [Pseudooceanicola albus]
MDTQEVGAAFVAAILGAVDGYLDGVDRQFQREGIPPWSAALVRVRMSERLRAALDAGGAFELAVSFDGGAESVVIA